MAEFEKHKDIIAAVEETQGVDQELRDNGRECGHFVRKKSGQWDQKVWDAVGNDRPRMQYDKCNPIIDEYMGEFERAEFSNRVRPAGGGSTKKTAKTYDGLIRNLHVISEAQEIFSGAARETLERGMAGWRIEQEYIDGDSFDQDLLIRPISDFIDRVWFDTGAIMRNMSDADWCVVLTSMPKKSYEKRWKKGSGTSVGESITNHVYYEKKEGVVVGEFLYKKDITVELAKMNTGAVYKIDEKFEMIRDELAATGVHQVAERTRRKKVVYSQLFDGSDLLEDSRKTIFEYLPVIPVFGNFAISEGKVLFRAETETLMDPQRALNYAESRRLEEGALRPKSKLFMTPEQAAGNESTLSTMNVNNDPVQLLNHVDGQMPPGYLGPGATDPELAITAQTAERHITTTANMFPSSMGDNPGLQSGRAIELQQNKGDNSTYKLFSAMRSAEEHTCRIMVKGIPQLYTEGRQIRVLGEDNTNDYVVIGEKIIDDQTGQEVVINDLGQGLYDVSCDVGAAFQSKQKDTVTNILEASAVDPSIMQLAGDVFLNNIPAPGMDIVAARKRALMIQQGMIPQEEFTDEEKAAAQQAQQAAQGQDQMSPMDQANLQIAQAEAEKAQAMTADTQSKMQERQEKTQLEMAKIQQKTEQMGIQAQLEQQKLQLQIQKLMAEQRTQNEGILKTQAETLKIIKEATGADVIVTPEVSEAYSNQAAIITETQKGT